MAQQKSRPTDPLEMMKQGSPAGTPLPPPAMVAPVVPEAPSPREAAAPDVTIDTDAPPPEPSVPPPPAKAVVHFHVGKDRRVVISRGGHATILRVGAEVSSESHDVDFLREQGLELIARS